MQVSRITQLPDNFGISSTIIITKIHLPIVNFKGPRGLIRSKVVVKETKSSQNILVVQCITTLIARQCLKLLQRIYTFIQILLPLHIKHLHDTRLLKHRNTLFNFDIKHFVTCLYLRRYTVLTKLNNWKWNLRQSIFRCAIRLIAIEQNSTSGQDLLLTKHKTAC